MLHALAEIMNSEEISRIVETMRAAKKKPRGYADFFGWSLDRDIEECGVVHSLLESMASDGVLRFHDVRIRGRGNDPPDCEALDSNGKRVAIEIAELVDESAIKRAKAGAIYDSAEWDRNKFIIHIERLLNQKNSKFPNLKGSPYEGGYCVVVFSDEPELPASKVREYLDGYKFKGLQHIDEAILLLSYEPGENCCPYFPLQLVS